MHDCACIRHAESQIVQPTARFHGFGSRRSWGLLEVHPATARRTVGFADVSPVLGEDFDEDLGVGLTPGAGDPRLAAVIAGRLPPAARDPRLVRTSPSTGAAMTDPVSSRCYLAPAGAWTWSRARPDPVLSVRWAAIHC